MARFTVRTEDAAKLFMCAMLGGYTLPDAGAQGLRTDHKVECHLFRKKADGTWFVGGQTTVEFGSTRITLPPGEVARGDFPFGVTDLHAILLNACGGTKTPPGPRQPASD
ncbi:hypothetical protein [Pseudorhodoplanes sp.]|uniref:hypothetical protein n=1 Tax=Pseudorhodoplanes sp. TaxID=1934341 RepID=UPI00391AE76B